MEAESQAVLNIFVEQTSRMHLEMAERLELCILAEGNYFVRDGGQ
jgi:hypothetical protein